MTQTARFVALAISTLVITAIPAPATANLIVNGSFELPGGGGILATGSTFFEGWVVTRDNIEVIGGCSDEAWCLDLDGSNFGGIAQSFSTVPGLQYRVTFELSGNPARYSPTEPLEKILGVSAAGSGTSFVFEVTPPLEGSPHDWVAHEWFFAATDLETTIEFFSLDSLELGHSGLFGPALDNVAVVPVPEPRTAVLVALGATLLALIRRRR